MKACFLLMFTLLISTTLSAQTYADNRSYVDINFMKDAGSENSFGLSRFGLNYGFSNGIGIGVAAASGEGRGPFYLGSRPSSSSNDKQKFSFSEYEFNLSMTAYKDESNCLMIHFGTAFTKETQVTTRRIYTPRNFTYFDNLFLNLLFSGSNYTTTTSTNIEKQTNPYIQLSYERKLFDNAGVFFNVRAMSNVQPSIGFGMRIRFFVPSI